LVATRLVDAHVNAFDRTADLYKLEGAADKLTPRWFGRRLDGSDHH
jgi:hypothetical protein